MASEQAREDMWSSISRRIQSVIVSAAIGIIFSEDTKGRVVTILNNRIDIPIMNERQEQELFEALWDAAREAVSEALDIEKPNNE